MSYPKMIYSVKLHFEAFTKKFGLNQDDVVVVSNSKLQSVFLPVSSRNPSVFNVPPQNEQTKI